MSHIEIYTIDGRKYKYQITNYRVGKKIKHKKKYIGPVEPANRKRNERRERKPKLMVRNLSIEEKSFVKKSLRHSGSFVKDRARIIQLSNEGNKVKQVCDKLKFDRKKVETVLRNFNKFGLKIFERKKNPGRNRRITKEERTLIISYLNTHPEKLGMHYNNWSHKKISAYAKKQGIEISPSQVGRIIKQDEIKYKKKIGKMYSDDPFFS
jgi:transposase